jgi:hypothetical protein
LKSKEANVSLGEKSGTHHGIGMDPKGNDGKKLGKMIAAIVTGTNPTESKFQGRNIILQSSSLDHDMSYIARNLPSMTNLACSFIVFTNNNGGIIR